MSSEPIPIDDEALLYRDEVMVVVNKPSGLAVHRGWAADDSYALDQVRDLVGQYVYPVHRLDKPTSGALVFALDKVSAHALQRAFEERRVIKRYLGLVRGVPPVKIEVDRTLAKAPNGVEQAALTRFERRAILKRRYSWVEAQPVTGRSHQIRRHLRHLRCPLIGDVKYGDGRQNRHFRSEHDFHRLALHAVEITLPHPRSEASLCVHAPLSSDLQRLVSSLGLHAHLAR